MVSESQAPLNLNSGITFCKKRYQRSCQGSQYETVPAGSLPRLNLLPPTKLTPQDDLSAADFLLRESVHSGGRHDGQEPAGLLSALMRDQVPPGESR